MRLSILFWIIFATSNLANAEKKTIGFISDLSGYNIESGTNCQKGYKLAIEEASPEVVNQIEFKFEDSQSSPKFAVNAFQKLKNNHDLIGVSAFSSPNSLAISPQALKANIPLVGLAGSTLLTEQNELAFSSWMSSTTEGSVTAQAIKDQTLNKVAIVTTENDYMIDVAKFFRLKVNNLAMQIVSDEMVSHELMDFKAIISRMLANQPEVFFINLHTGSAPAFLKQLRQSGYHGPVFGTFYLSRENEIMAAGKQNAEGVKIVSIKLNNIGYAKAYLEMFKDQKSTVLDYACYAGAAHMIHSLNRLAKANKPLVPENLLNEMNSNNSVKLFEQTLTVKDRWVEYEYEIKVILDGKVVSQITP